ncbi:MAG TPA: hypothetical protein VGQ61_13945 [Candidatus Angelobacter sp.]|jgi:hypothetical protein|nr:hypothetical protein [Candidatus Angelobacter sp.]
MLKPLVLFCGFFCIVPKALPQPNKTALGPDLVTRCAPGLEYGHERVFANPGLKSWKEYASLRDVPQLNGDNGEIAFAVKTTLRANSVLLVQNGEDYSILEESCFVRSGSLKWVHYRMQTGWGWGYEDDRGFNTSGKTLQRSIRFFDTATEKTILRPRQADDVPDFLKPTIYRSFDSLPFATTLKKPRVNAP